MTFHPSIGPAKRALTHPHPDVRRAAAETIAQYRLPTDAELASIYPAPLVRKPDPDRLMWGAADWLLLAIGIETLLLVAAFVVAQAMKWAELW